MSPVISLKIHPDRELTDGLVQVVYATIVPQRAEGDASSRLLSKSYVTSGQGTS